MKRSVFWLVPVGLVLAFVALAGACGSSDGSLSLEQYFEKVDALDEESTNRSDELDGRFEEVDDADEARDLIADLMQIFKDFRDGLRDLDAPDEAKEAHDKAIEGFGLFIEEVEAALEEAGSLETADEFFEAIDDVETTGIDQAEEACVELEEIATDNGIDVDFDCGEGDSASDDEETATAEPSGSGELEEYYEALDAAEDEYRASNESVGEQLDALDDSTVDEAVNLVLDGQEGIDAFLDALESMDPPAEVRAVHAETVAGFQAASEWIDEYMVEFANATSIADVDALFSSPEFAEISAGLDGTCDALQAIADQNSIVVDLGCGE